MKSILTVLAFIISCAVAPAADLTIQAAASLTDVLRELGPTFEKANGDHLAFNFGASSELARQIQEGAPADVFFSADEAKMDALDKKGLIEPDTRADVLGNSLVFVVPSDSALTLKSAADLIQPGFKKIVVGEPNTVPAGVYAKAYLTQVGVWSKVESKVVPAASVRAALAAVESGDADVGAVYKTDALISKKVKIILEASPAEGPKIVYPAAALKSSGNLAEARKFLAFLRGPEAKAAFAKYGFTVLP